MFLKPTIKLPQKTQPNLFKQLAVELEKCKRLGRSSQHSTLIVLKLVIFYFFFLIVASLTFLDSFLSHALSCFLAVIS
jgi:hypothetical protein